MGASSADYKSKKPSFWRIISYSTQWLIISWLDCDVWQKMDCAWWPAGPRRSYKALPKAKLAPREKKNKSINVHCHCLVVCCPSDPLQHLRSLLSKSISCIENCNAWSWHWSTERDQFFSITTSNCTLHNQCFKNWTNWAIEFCLICHVHLTSLQPTTASSSRQLFCRERYFHNQKKA